MSLIGIHVAQHRSGSEKRAYLGGVNDVKKRPQNRTLRKTIGAGTHTDLEGPWTTQRERSLRNEPTQLRKLPDMPNKISSRLSKISWLTVSKATLTSNNANRLSCEPSIQPHKYHSHFEQRCVGLIIVYIMHAVTSYLVFRVSQQHKVVGPIRLKC